MEECVPNHSLLLPENYIVQSIENLPVSVIDCGKVEMPSLVRSEPLSDGTSVIHLTDVNSNVKLKVLHPLELEVQRDFHLKQLLKRHPLSVTQAPGHDRYLDKAFECLTPSGVLQVQAIPSKEAIPSINIKETDTTLCHVAPRPMFLEKEQFIIVSDNPMFVNVSSDQVKEPCRGTESIVEKTSEVVSNDKEEVVCSVDVREEKTAESNSESDEDDIQPVCDYEPDPDKAHPLGHEKNEKPNKCYVCFKSFRQKKNMYAHIRKIHSTQPKIEGGILCPLCKMHALRQEHLRQHLETLHKIPIEKEEKLFNTMDEFLSWKELTERETLSFYVSKSSSKLLANNQQKTYYKCHRSGNYVTLKKENRKKRLKSQGSNKIGATCPAAIEVTENVHGINVTFWKTHVGHDNDLARLVLTKEEKAKIIEYLASGVSSSKILETFKKECSKSTAVPSRLNIVSTQDLRNVKKIHDMKANPEMFSRKKIIQGRKPVKEKMLRRASQSLVIEKADLLLNLLETTDIKPEFRPKVCLMIDNLISTVKRRAVKKSKKESQSRRGKGWTRRNRPEEREYQEMSEDVST